MSDMKLADRRNVIRLVIRNMKSATIVLVVNLKSRQSLTAIHEIVQTFKAKRATFEVVAVKDPSNIKTAFQKAIDMKPATIVLGGGDGTLINGIEYLSGKGYRGKVGLLPLGTANYLARNLHIPLDIPGSIEVILRGKERELPIGIANGKLFALSLIMGITQAASENVSDELKRRLGQFAYVLQLFKETKNHEPFHYVIESPSLKKPLKGLTHQIVVYNSDLNQQFKLVPDHRLTKPTLKVVVSRCGRSKLKLYGGFLLHVLTFGRVRRYMRVFETDTLTIATKPLVSADYDGETFGTSPFEISMYDRTVRVLC